MNEHSPVCLSIPETTVERIRAALLIAASSAEELALEAAGDELSQAEISMLPLSKRRAVEGFLADRAECLALLGMMESGQ